MRPAVRRLLAALLTATAATAASPAVAAPDFAVTAHRGGPTRLLGENTMAAFRNALADGATAVEADVRRTFDDRLVVLHDSGLGRTTTCTGPIGAWTRAAWTGSAWSRRAAGRCPTSRSCSPSPPAGRSR